MKKKIICILIMVLFSICILTSVAANSVDEALTPLKGEIEKNVTSLTTVVFIMIGIFAIIAFTEALITGNKSKSINMLSNKGIRFLEVLFLIILLILVVYEYVRVENIIIKCIGILLSLFCFYQRVSNKNRKWAYTILTLDMLLYIGINIF